MMSTIHQRHEFPRGCGVRKPGGLYLVCDDPFGQCVKLPVVLDRCPTCDHGIKPSRGWTWVDGTALLSQAPCQQAPCHGCRLAQPLGRAGLLWIGEAYYKTPGHWTREAAMMGVSRRISAIPREFVLGETWVLVAHRKACFLPCAAHLNTTDCPHCGGIGYLERAGIFSAFRPTAIEYIVKGNESEDDLQRLEARGITLVNVTLVGDTEPTLDLQVDDESVDDESRRV